MRLCTETYLDTYCTYTYIYNVVVDVKNSNILPMTICFSLERKRKDSLYTSLTELFADPRYFRFLYTFSFYSFVEMLWNTQHTYIHIFG